MNFKPTGSDVGVRLDVWLSRRLPELSRSRIQSLIKSGHITVNGHQVRAHINVAEGMKVDVSVPSPVPAGPAGENIPLDVLYEDADIIVINKQVGLVVHPSAGHASGTLVNALLYHCDDLSGVGGEMRPGIVHRLDKDTSGALVAAKNEQSMENLARQFKEGRVRKEYLAVVCGTPSPHAGKIETPIGRSGHDRKKMSARPVSGRLAVSHYKIEESFNDFCLVRVMIETGRTHQIRVHMAHIGHPVLGDKQYGGRGRKRKNGGWGMGDGGWEMGNGKWEMGNGKWGRGQAGRQMLHAEVLGFEHPAHGREVQFKAPLPEDMKEVIEKLRGNE